MGRKVHPIGFRLNINKPWDGRWYADGDEYVDQLHQDLEIRKLIHAQTGNAGVSRVEVERFPGKVKVVVNTAKPGILIGRKGIVSERIDATQHTGRVAIDGDDWKAVSDDGSVIEKGTTVEIVKLESIIVTVKQ